MLFLLQVVAFNHQQGVEGLSVLRVEDHGVVVKLNRARDVLLRVQRVAHAQVSGRLKTHENTVLLRSEIPSGMCAKLRTVAASNN